MKRQQRRRVSLALRVGRRRVPLVIPPDAERFGPALVTPGGPGVLEMIQLAVEFHGGTAPEDLAEHMARMSLRSVDERASHQRGADKTNKQRREKSPKENKARYARFEKLWAAGIRTRKSERDARAGAIKELAESENVTVKRMRDFIRIYEKTHARVPHHYASAIGHM